MRRPTRERLNEDGEPERRRPTLADRFIARRFADWERAVHPKTIDQLKAGVRKAHRFVLTEEAITRIAEIITTIPDLLVRECRFARAPYDVCWIEFPAHVMFSYMRARDPEIYDIRGEWGDVESSDHTIGYLIDHERVNIICGGTVANPDDAPKILPIQYHLHSEWTGIDCEDFKRRAGALGPIRLNGEDFDAIEMFMFGSTFMDLTAEQRAEVSGRNSISYLPSNPLHPSHDKWNEDGAMVDAIRGSVGELRNIIAILLVMNRPSLTKYVRTASNGRGFQRGKLMPYFSHTTVTIDLDTRPTLKLIGTPAGEAVSKRRGEVKGHYCHDETTREYSRIAGCVHEFEQTHGPEDKWAPWPDAPIGLPGEPGVPRNWVCASCGGKRWFIRDHGRGDATKGFVIKDGYEVTVR